MQNQVGIMRPGSTWSSLGSTVLGRRQIEPDKNWGTEPAGYLTGMDTEYIVCKNTSGGTLARGTLVKFDFSTPAPFQYVSATAGVGDRPDGVVDSYIASTVASNDFFLAVRKGPCRLKTSNSTSISAGKALMPAASGLVVEDILGDSPNTVGFALEAVAAASTLFRAYVDLTGARRSISSRTVAAGSTLTLSAIHNERTILLDTAAGSTVTLPSAAGTGIRYKFVISVVATSNNHVVQCTSSGNFFTGLIWTQSDDAGNPVKAYASNGTSNNVITLNRSTKGSTVLGEWLQVEDLATNVWHVMGCTASTGTEASPFSG